MTARKAQEEGQELEAIEGGPTCPDSFPWGGVVVVVVLRCSQTRRSLGTPITGQPDCPSSSEKCQPRPISDHGVPHFHVFWGLVDKNTAFPAEGGPQSLTAWGRGPTPRACNRSVEGLCRSVAQPFGVQMGRQAPEGKRDKPPNASVGSQRGLHLSLFPRQPHFLLEASGCLGGDGVHPHDFLMRLRSSGYFRLIPQNDAKENPAPPK